MNQERMLTILQAPHITEKMGLQSRQYGFKVERNATKAEIKKAVEHAFNVKVKHVRVCNVKSRATRYRQMLGRHRAWKKAYVSLLEGYQIEAGNTQS